MMNIKMVVLLFFNICYGIIHGMETVRTEKNEIILTGRDAVLWEKINPHLCILKYSDAGTTNIYYGENVWITIYRASNTKVRGVKAFVDDYGRGTIIIVSAFLIGYGYEKHQPILNYKNLKKWMIHAR